MSHNDVDQLTEFSKLGEVEETPSSSSLSGFFGKWFRGKSPVLDDSPEGAGMIFGSHRLSSERSLDDPTSSASLLRPVPKTRSISNVTQRLSNVILGRGSQDSLDAAGRGPIDPISGKELVDYNNSDVRQYWMPDNRSKECYECQEKFTTLRRRHHCRICGQIFCSRCCNREIPGRLLGYMGNLRLCNYCCDNVTDRLDKEAGLKPSNSDKLETSLQPSGSYAMITQPTSRPGPLSAVSENDTGSISVISSTLGPWQTVTETRSSSLNGNSGSGGESLAPELLSVTNLPFSSLLKTEEQDENDEQPSFEEFEPEWVRSINQQPNIDLSMEDGNPATSIWEARRRRSLEPDSVDNDEVNESIGDVSVDAADTGKTSPTKTIPLIPISENAEPLERKQSTTSRSELSSCSDADLQQSLHQSFDTQSVKLLKYLLKREKLDHKIWMDVLWPLIRDIANTLNPNVRDKKDDLDVLNYFHVKKLVSSELPTAQVVWGTVCSKAVVDTRMRQEFERPNILLLGGSVEYERVEGKFSSIDPIIMQENDYLRNAVHRILSRKPNVVIVEKTVGRIAQRLLRREGVTLVYNVKAGVMNRIARCCEGDITHSIEGHFVKPKLGTCHTFRNVSVPLLDGTSKNLLFFEGCNPHLESTVILSGPTIEELKRIKRILRFMVSALYSSKLELKTLESNRICMSEPSIVAEDIVAQCDVCSANKRLRPDENTRIDQAPSLPDELTKATLVASPFLCFDLPYLETSKGKTSSHLGYFKKSIYPFKPLQALEPIPTEESTLTKADTSFKTPMKSHVTSGHEFFSVHLQQTAADTDFRNQLANFRAQSGRKFREQYRKDLEQNQLHKSPVKPKDSVDLSSKRKRRMPSGPLDVLCPFSHSRIAVLFCSYSAKSENAPGFCIDPWVVWMEFYGRHDLPLGDFLQRYCFNPTYMCPKRDGKHCEVSMLEHTRKIVHRNASIEITSQSIMEVAANKPTAGATTEILTWSWCARCQCTTQSSAMSQEMWQLSFAKYLDYLFNGTALPSHITGKGQENICTHCCFHQHDHYFSQNNYVSSFKIRKIKLLDVSFSPMICSVAPFTVAALNLVEESKIISEKAGSIFSRMLEQTCDFKNHADAHKFQGLLRDLTLIHEKGQEEWRDEMNISQTTLTGLSPLNTTQISSKAPVYLTVMDSLTKCKKILSRKIYEWNQTVTDHQNKVKKRPTSHNHSDFERVKTAPVLEEHSSEEAGKVVPSISALVNDQLSPAHGEHVKRSSSEAMMATQGDEDRPNQKNRLAKSNGEPLSLWRLSNPFPVSEHLDLPTGKVPVIVRDGEIGSIIAYALSSPDYQEQLSSQPANSGISDMGEVQDGKPNHIELQFQDSSSKYYCKVYYPQEFVQIRQLLFGDGNDGFIRSLCRTERWAPKGGKSGASFFRTLDKRFIMKTLSRFEITSFLKFGPHYFQYITTAAKEQNLTALAKIYGVFRVCFKNEHEAEKKDILVMEHLFYGKKVSHVYDLKGSLRNRLASTSGKTPFGTREGDPVELDLNLLKKAWTSPHYMYPHSKTVLTMAVQNDSHFLSNHHVMDYSLLVGVDEDTGQIIIGIIDYIRTYTLDKKLEFWVKSVAVPGQLPTVISPEMYRTRFTEAIDTYFPVAPDQWAGLAQGMLN